MRNPKSEIRNPKEIRNPNPETRIRMARSVLECSGPPPLSPPAGRSTHTQSASGLAQSKTWRLGLVYFCFLLSTFSFWAQGQYTIDWSTIDGGGGTSTGGVYSVTGTIGQPDAGAMSGGNYTLQGGFWGVIAAVQTPGAPLLTVTRTMTNTVAVSWPVPDTGWKLHATTKLATAGSVWTEIPPPYATNATSLYFVEPTPVGNKFYRLHKP